jgi:hypothetical protein
MYLPSGLNASVLTPLPRGRLTVMSSKPGSGLISQRASTGLLLVLTAVVALVFFLLPRIPQPAAYHLFADRRRFLGIPNFANVVSNLPFAVIGLWGLIFLLRSNSDQMPDVFLISESAGRIGVFLSDCC